MNCIKLDEHKNKILGYQPKLENSSIIFEGNNNRLICEENVTLKDSILEFCGNNSIIYLSSNKNNYYLRISIFNNSVFYIGENCYINQNQGGLHCALSEEKHIIIGKECLFSFGIWMRLADPHLIYDTKSLKRINLSKSIYIGDHVWIGQDALILKGTHIGSGSILGAKSLISNKIISSHTLWGGVPAELIREDVLFDGSSVHSYTKKETIDSMEFKKNQWIYKNEGKIIPFEDIENELNSIADVDEKIKYIQKIINSDNYNRFFIE